MRFLLPSLGLLLCGTACIETPIRALCAEFPIGEVDGCGDGCDLYCEAMNDSCPDTFGSIEACIVSCRDEPPGGQLIPDGNFGDREGNSLSCRISYALEEDCEEAALVGSKACSGVSCQDYCSELMSTGCSDAYASVGSCEDSCAFLTPGTDDMDANTVACRAKYAGLATLEPSPANCNAASIGGGRTCGDDPCEVYCDLLETNCQGDNAVYTDRSTCMQTCALFEPGEYDDWDFDKEVNSIACRLYHAGPPAAALPATHCPHTGAYNEMHCGIDTTQVLADWPCITYCDLVMGNCPGVYATLAGCRVDCATFPEVVNLQEGEIPQLYPVSTLECPTR